MAAGECTGDTKRIILNGKMKTGTMISALTRLAYLGLVVFLFNGCSSGNVNEPSDTLEAGTIHISADESFKPVIDSQIRVFESSYPNAKIVAHYKPEAECLKDFAVDSIRMVIGVYTKRRTIPGRFNEDQPDKTNHCLRCHCGDCKPGINGYVVYYG